MEKSIRELIEKYPNDTELGIAVRELYFKEKKRNETILSWIV